MSVVDVWHRAIHKTLYGNFEFHRDPYGGEKLRDLKPLKWLEIATTEQGKYKQHFRQVTVPLFHYLQ